MAPRDKKGILFILRAVVQSYLYALCVHSRLANVLLRFNLDNKFQRGGGTESYVCEQTLENQSRQLPESALSSRSPQNRTLTRLTNKWMRGDALENLVGYSFTFKGKVGRERTPFYSSFLNRCHAFIISCSSRLSRGVFLSLPVSLLVPPFPVPS